MVVSVLLAASWEEDVDLRLRLSKARARVSYETNADPPPVFDALVNEHTAVLYLPEARLAVDATELRKTVVPFAEGTSQYQRKVLIVEETAFSLSYLAQHQPLIAVLGLSMLPVADRIGFTRLLCEMVKTQRHAVSVPAAPPLHAADAVALLARVPGVSAAAAERVVAHFGSLKNIATASTREFAACEGLPASAASRLQIFIARELDLDSIHPHLA